MPGAEPPPDAVRAAVATALAEDLLPLGDLTASLVPAGRQTTAAFVARAAGVVAGVACAAEALGSVDPGLRVKWGLSDGDRVAIRGEIGTVSGSLASIVTAERVALNFLSHLSGVASLTRRYVDAAEAANPACRVLDTRKTTPGLRALEKAAVRAGGGRNHRANLSEGVLVKDNHLGGMSISEAAAAALEMWPGRMVEVECENLSQVSEALEAGATMLLLDNMTPSEVAACVALARESSGSPPRGAAGDRRASRVLVEASGGITLETVGAYAAAGADLVSVGALTHSAPILDIGFDLLA